MPPPHCEEDGSGEVIRVPTRAVPWLFAAACLSAQAQPADPLPSWNEGASRRARRLRPGVTDTASKEFVRRRSRRHFRHDGTLWAEQPLYVQFVSCSTS